MDDDDDGDEHMAHSGNSSATDMDVDKIVHDVLTTGDFSALKEDLHAKLKSIKSVRYMTPAPTF